MNYEENKKILDKIRNDYACAGEIIFRSALQTTIDDGLQFYRDAQNVEAVLKQIDERHDKAEAEGKVLFMTRNFEKAIIECAAEIAQVIPYDLLLYVQKEIWIGSTVYGEPSYERAIEIIRDFMSYTADRFGSWRCNEYETFSKFKDIGFTDEELCYFGYEDLLELEEE